MGVISESGCQAESWLDFSVKKQLLVSTVKRMIAQQNLRHRPGLHKLFLLICHGIPRGKQLLLKNNLILFYFSFISGSSGYATEWCRLERDSLLSYPQPRLIQVPSSSSLQKP